MKVICIDDSHRPAEVPVNQWIKKGEEYTVIKVVNCLGQGIKGYELAEVKINAALYKYFAASRFRLVEFKPEEELELEEVFA
jgi:hypothetical protein